MLDEAPKTSGENIHTILPQPPSGLTECAGNVVYEYAVGDDNKQRVVRGNAWARYRKCLAKNGDGLTALRDEYAKVREAVIEGRTFWIIPTAIQIDLFTPEINWSAELRLKSEEN